MILLCPASNSRNTGVSLSCGTQDGGNLCRDPYYDRIPNMEAHIMLSERQSSYAHDPRPRRSFLIPWPTKGGALQPPRAVPEG